MKNIRQLMSLKGRVALITGGAGHLGYAMAIALAQAGAHIILVDRGQAQPQAKAALLKKKYEIKSVGIELDLTDKRQVEALPAAVRRHMGRLDILINCAALVGTSQLKGWAVPFLQQDIDTWCQAMEINLTSVFALSQQCYPLLKKSKNATIINIASIYGILGPDMSLYQGTKLGNPAAYAASKGGLIQLTRWLATNLAPEVRVNAISIGGVFRNHEEPFLSRYKKKTPLNRMATEEDILGAALYLASDLSLYVTGHNLVVDGGLSTW